jgi:hypothetical protein
MVVIPGEDGDFFFELRLREAFGIERREVERRRFLAEELSRQRLWRRDERLDDLGNLGNVHLKTVSRELAIELSVRHFYPELQVADAGVA